MKGKLGKFGLGPRVTIKSLKDCLTNFDERYENRRVHSSYDLMNFGENYENRRILTRVTRENM